MFYQTTPELVSSLIKGLQERSIDFVVSDNTLGCQLVEIYVPKAQELIIIPRKRLDIPTIRWILEVRTPLNIRIDIFTNDLPEVKLRLIRALKILKEDGLELSSLKRAISIQDLTEINIQQLLESIENRLVHRGYGKPPFFNSHTKSFTHIKENSSSLKEKQEALLFHLQNAIKTYWTERYLARYLNTPLKNIQKLAKQIGIEREMCGHETLYFFDRKKALKTYFQHIMKGLFDELNIEYQEISQQNYVLPDLGIELFFFDGKNEELTTLYGKFVHNHNLIIVAPQIFLATFKSTQNSFLKVLPLNQEKIKKALVQTIRHRRDYISTYSSGISN